MMSCHVMSCHVMAFSSSFLSMSRDHQQREAAARLVHSDAGVTCPPPCNATSLAAAIVEAHGIERRRGALRSSAALRETGGVGRAGDLVSGRGGACTGKIYFFTVPCLLPHISSALGRRKEGVFFLSWGDQTGRVSNRVIFASVPYLLCRRIA